MTLHLNPTQPIYLLTTRTVAASSWTGHNHYNPSRQLWFYCQSIPLDSERHWVQELRLTCVHYEIKIFMFAFCLQELVYVCTRQPDIIVRSVRKDSMVQQQTVHPTTVLRVPVPVRVLVSNRYGDTNCLMDDSLVIVLNCTELYCSWNRNTAFPLYNQLPNRIEWKRLSHMINTIPILSITISYDLSFSNSLEW